jgi:hypothetical protein
MKAHRAGGMLGPDVFGLRGGQAVEGAGAPQFDAVVFGGRWR